MKVSDFDFALPDELIAQEPLARRDASRLLVLPRTTGVVTHHQFTELPSLLQRGDLLVFNDAKVIPVRLHGHKTHSGGKVELLLIEPRPRPDGSERWYALGQASKGLKPGQGLAFDGGLTGEVTAPEGDGAYEVRLSERGDALLALLEQVGEVPIPPYIKSHHPKAASDPNFARYQTIFARRPGASAAPTAGLHFTQEVLRALENRGILRTTVTLYVGPGTFLPVRTDNVLEHRMHAERYEITPEAVRAVDEARVLKGRVIAVGTTSLRALESWGGDAAKVSGSTSIFIYPGYAFRVIDGLFTNFHLPKSTLLMLVSALAGRDRVLAAYAEAIRERYRFFSYGDAMLVS